MKRLLVLLSAILLWTGVQTAAAQGRTVTGRVTAAETGQPMSGVTVFVKGASQGVRTDVDGRYSLSVPAGATTLVFSQIGFGSKELPITGSVVDAQLAQQAVALEGLVVTSLGVTREKSRLGTAQQQVSSEELNQTHAQSVVNQIQGKVSGVQITGSGTQGGSQRIVIRGANSITGNNTPLFVVDGFPVSNIGHGGDPNGAFDYGSAINDLNPEDIESISVLKGPNAAALYGSRAANGAIVITTKKARAGAVHTEASVTYTADRPSILPDFQNLYGQGAGGEFLFVDGAGGGVADWADQSWGPRLDGRTTGCIFKPNTTTYDTSVPCAQFNAPQGAPWVAHPDNVRSFFDTGSTLSTTVGVSGGTDRASARLSMGVDDTKGYIPNNSFRKFSGLLNGQLRANDRLTANGTLQYLRNSAVNRPGTGYNVGILEQFIWFGRQVDLGALRNYGQGAGVNGGPTGREFNWNYNYHNNPYWLQYANPMDDARDRFIGNVGLTYDIADGLQATARTGSDIFQFDIARNFAQGNLVWADPSFFGGFSDYSEYQNTNTTDLLLQGDRQLGSALQITALLGGTQNRTRYRSSSVTTNGISSPGIYNVSNAAITPSLSQYSERRQVNSVYGSLATTFNGWWTVEGTARNDWSSTLPAGNNSYFYPSVNTSVVLTDALPRLQNRFLSFAKLRGSIAKVGNDASAYQLRTTYGGYSTKFGGLPLFTLNDVLANQNLKPEITTSSEAGLELGFLDGRLTFDGSVYSKSTRDQIFNVAISPTTGFSNKAINAGRIDNKGFDALLTVVPLQTADWNWSSTFNFSRNRSRVAELYPGIQRIILGRSWYTNIEARVGEPYGAIVGYAFARDSASGKILTSDGITVLDPSPKVLGNIQPDWTGGWSNTLSFRRFTLNALLDVRHGGDIVSVTNFFGDYAGVTKASLQGRENAWNDPGVVVNGIDQATGKPNTVNVTAEQYYQNIFPVMEPYVYDGGWVKLRELRFGVDLPERWAGRMNARRMNVALIGRNLWSSTHVPNIDPEFSYSIGNFQGIEFAALPNTRSIGVSVSVTP